MMSLEDLCVQLLHEEDEFFLSVHRLYDLVLVEREDLDMDQGAFVEFLRSNPDNFTLLDFGFGDDSVMDSDMEELKESGMDGGIKVCLRDRYDDEESYLIFLSEYIHGMITSLEALWSAKVNSFGENDSSVQEIQKILQKAYSIRDSLRNEKYLV